MKIGSKSYSWTQAICDGDWDAYYPGMTATRFRPEVREQETCCYCGQPTTSGIYIRVDPRGVPHPTEET